MIKNGKPKSDLEKTYIFVFKTGIYFSNSERAENKIGLKPRPKIHSEKFYFLLTH